MRQVGVVTVGGQYVGVVMIDRGGPTDAFEPNLGGFDGHGVGERGGRASGGDHRHGRPHSGGSHAGGGEHHRGGEHMGGHRHGPGHYARGEERARQPAPEGHRKGGETGDVPYSSSGNPFDRSRFSKELEEKPWLREKMKHISLGENQDPRANMAVQETMMNRAITRGTSLEAQVKRHRSSGVDEGGYYAGWAPSYSTEKAAMFDRNLGAVLKGSNISNYATDNSSGDLAARERASGAFKHHTTINGESFFSPGSAEPQLRQRWQTLNHRAQEHENAKAHPDPALEGAITPPSMGPQSSIDKPFKMAAAGAPPAIIPPYPYAPDPRKFDDGDPDESPPKRTPSGINPPTPGDKHDPAKTKDPKGYGIPSDYDLG